jgi:hypothetical protein
MKINKYIIISLLIGILLGSTGCYAIFLLTEKTKSYITQPLGREKAYNYLINSYNSTLGLCYEYPGSNRYWVTHDNVFASYALQNWNRTVADNITKTVKRIAKEYNLIINSEGIPLDTKAEVLLGYTISFLSEFSNNASLNSSYYGSSLLSENATGVPAIFSGYADLLCYASLNEWRKQNYSGADYYYGKVIEMWDWDGRGFKDSDFNSSLKYATYKLGLFYLLSRAMNKHFDFEKELIERVWSCQVASGGFKTHYYSNGTFPLDAQTNTETASIILLADIPSLFEYDC